MPHLLRRNLSFIWPYFTGIIIIPYVFYFTHLPQIPFSTYIVLLYILLSAPFKMDKDRQIDRFMISLPISKRKIVFARYIELTISSAIGTTLILLLEALGHQNPAAKSMITIFIFSTFVCTVIALALPAFYFFDKMWKAIISHIILFIAGSIIFFIVAFSSYLDWPVDIILSIVDLNPYIILTLFSLILLGTSYFMSCSIYAKKDH